MFKIFKWSGVLSILIIFDHLMMQRLTVTLSSVLNSSTLRKFSPGKGTTNIQTQAKMKILDGINDQFWVVWTKYNNLVTTDMKVVLFFISNQNDCWNTCLSSLISKITLMNIVRLTICSFNMIWTSGACLNLRFNDGTQVFLSGPNYL